MDNENYVICMLCGKKLGSINNLHLKSHKMVTREYVEMFPDSVISSKSMLEKRRVKLKGRIASPETRKKLSESNKLSWQNNPNQGRTGVPLSEEMKEVVSKKLMGHSTSEETRQKIGLSGIGRIPWNKGLTKYDDERIMGMSDKVRQWNIEYMTPEMRAKIGQSLKKRYAEGMKIPNSKNGRRLDLNMSFRSSWEANYARILIFNNKKIEYEVDSFALYRDDGTIDCVYTPDFKVQDKMYIEIKGHADSADEWGCSCKRCQRDKRKLLLMSIKYPDINIILIGRKEYRALCLKYNFFIDNWEFSKWDKDDLIWKKES